MKCKAIIQINLDTGEKNICFTQDPVTPLEDFLLPWPNSKTVVEEVLILASDGVLDNVVDTEFRSVLGDIETLVEMTLSPEETALIQKRLEALFTK